MDQDTVVPHGRVSQITFGHCHTNALVPLADKNRNVCMSHGNSNGMYHNITIISCKPRLWQQMSDQDNMGEKRVWPGLHCIFSSFGPYLAPGAKRPSVTNVSLQVSDRHSCDFLIQRPHCLNTKCACAQLSAHRLVGLIMRFVLHVGALLSWGS